MKAEARQRAVELRRDHEWGYSAIARELNVSKSTLSRWLQDMPLSEERILELRRDSWGRGEAKRERFRETMRAKQKQKDILVYEKQKKKFSRISDQALFVAGLLLYEAEGEKTSRSDISFTNTDPILIRFFSAWVERYLNLPRSQFRIQLHLYENMDILTEERFWLKALGLQQSQLWKSQVRPLRPKSFSYQDTSRHGTCRLYIGSVPKKTELRLSIRAFFDTYEEHMRA